MSAHSSISGNTSYLQHVMHGDSATVLFESAGVQREQRVQRESIVNAIVMGILNGLVYTVINGNDGVNSVAETLCTLLYSSIVVGGVLKSRSLLVPVHIIMHSSVALCKKFVHCNGFVPVFVTMSNNDLQGTERKFVITSLLLAIEALGRHASGCAIIYTKEDDNVTIINYNDCSVLLSEIDDHIIMVHNAIAYGEEFKSVLETRDDRKCSEYIQMLIANECITLNAKRPLYSEEKHMYAPYELTRLGHITPGIRKRIIKTYGISSLEHLTGEIIMQVIPNNDNYDNVVHQMCTIMNANFGDKLNSNFDFVARFVGCIAVFVDLETVGGLTFMSCVTIYDTSSGNVTHIQFLAKKLKQLDSELVINFTIECILQIIKQNRGQHVVLFHYSGNERAVFGDALLQYCEIIDMYELLVNNGIGIKGAFDYKLKSVVNVISTKPVWASDCKNGLIAMNTALECHMNGTPFRTDNCGEVTDTNTVTESIRDVLLYNECDNIATVRLLEWLINQWMNNA